MNEITLNLQCVVMRNGIEIWLEEARVEKLKQILTSSERHGFIELDSNTINSADVSGIFSAEIMEEMRRRKNYEWKCQFNTWHKQKEVCECRKTKSIKKKYETTGQPVICEKCDDLYFEKQKHVCPVSTIEGLNGELQIN